MPTERPTIRRPDRWILLPAGFVIFVFLAALWGMRLSPAAREARQFLDNLPAEQILEVRLTPYSVSSLVPIEVRITDRKRIASLAALLRSAQRVSPNHPKARWLTNLRLVTAERDYGGLVESTSNGQGVLIHYASEVEGGWSYGARRADALGPLLESWVASESRTTHK